MMSKFYLVEAEQEVDIRFGAYKPRGEICTCADCKFRYDPLECWRGVLWSCDSDFCSRGEFKDEILADKG